MEEKLECKNIVGYDIWQGTTPKVDDVDIGDFLINEEFFDYCLIEFDFFMKTFCSKNNRNLYNQNMHLLKVNKEKTNLLKKIRNSLTDLKYDDFITYSTGDNKITLKDVTLEHYLMYKKAVLYELLHMASRKNVGMVGFSQKYNTVNGKVDIGTMLNEGYTEYLKNKFFIKNIEGPYKEQMVIAYGIENIVGQAKMMEAYFNADLYGLVKEISKYTSEAEAMDLIIRTDIISHSDDKHKELGFTDIKNHIAKIYKNKLDMSLNSKSIDQEEYEKLEFENIRMYLSSKNPTFNIKENIFTKKKKIK